jgi:F-box interacting protein
MEDNNDGLLDEQNEAVEAQVSLPQDIQQTVLAFLPGRVVLKLRAVCRFWRDCIQVPNFVDRHLNNALCFHQSIAFFTSMDDGLFCMYTFDPTTMNCKSLDFVLSCRFQMSDPCNGLVCAYDSRGAVEVLNPLTMKHVILPVSELESRALSSEYFLGSVQSTNEYKVVCIRHQVQFMTFEVCTVGTQSWRAVRQSANFTKTSKAVIVNGIMHWLLLDVASDFTRTILLFNLTYEIFSETAVPDAIKDHNLELFEGKGKLHLLAMPSKGSASEVSEIWVSNSTCTVWDHMCNMTFVLPLGMKLHFLHKKKLFYGNQRRFYYIDLEGGGGFHINVQSDECIVSSGIFVDSLLLHSMTGLVDSRTLLMGSDHAGSSSHATGSSSSGAGKSFKEAKRNKKMKWRLTQNSAKKT